MVTRRQIANVLGVPLSSVSEAVRFRLKRWSVTHPVDDPYHHLARPTPFQLTRSLIDREVDVWPRQVTLGALVGAAILAFLAGVVVGGVV